jgi:hypothetical protein
VKKPAPAVAKAAAPAAGPARFGTRTG